jgi:hypothetical protein
MDRVGDLRGRMSLFYGYSSVGIVHDASIPAEHRHLE